jgi:hypothetical protein
VSGTAAAAGDAGHQALVWLLGPRDSTARAIGLKALDQVPRLNTEASFEHFGRTIVGRIERLDPADWKPGQEGLPKIYVIER